MTDSTQKPDAFGIPGGQPPAPDGQPVYPQPGPAQQTGASAPPPPPPGVGTQAWTGSPVPPPPSGTGSIATTNAATPPPPPGTATPPPPGAAAQPAPLQQPEPQKHHVHHSYIWLGGISTALTVAIALAFAFFMGLMGEGVNIMQGGTAGSVIFIVLGAIVLFLVIAGIFVGLQYLAYKNLYYEIGPEEFSVYSGIITKRKVHVPYQRIQSVNQRMSLLQRLFGVCTINIDTAGGSTNKAVVVPYVRNTEAERLRTELFARKQMILSGQAAGRGHSAQGAAAAPPQGAPVLSGTPAPSTAPQGAPVYTAAPGTYNAPAPSAPSNVLDTPAGYISDVRGIFGGEVFDTGRVTYEYGLSNKELILSGLSNSTGFALMVAAIIGAVMTIVGYAVQTSIGQELVQQGVDLAMGAITSNLIVPFVIIVLIILVFVWAMSIMGTCISYGGFKASRRGTRIEVQHGLIQHQFHGVDIDRVQSVIVRQGFIRRPFGYCELSLGKIDALAAEASEGQKNTEQTRGLVVHPFVKLDRVPEILNGLVPEFAGVPTEQLPLPKVSLKRALIRRCILHGSALWLAVLVAIVQIALNNFASLDVTLDSYTLISGLSVINIICYVLYALCLVILIFEIVGSVLWYKNSSFAFNHDFMQITNGGFTRESISFPRKKIQFGTVRSNPLQRRKHVATINARTAAGISGTTMRLVDVSESDADNWLAWVIPGGNKLT